MKAGPLGTSASIWALVVGAGLASSSIEQGLFLDFTSSAFQSSTGFYGSANVIDYTTPTNNYYSSPDKQASSFLTYTSPSPKIVMGPSGTLQYAPHNLILQSDNLATTWASTGGSNSSTTFTEDTSTGNHYFRQIISSVLSGYTYNFSIDLTANGRTAFLVEITSGVADAYAYVDLSTGTIASSSGTTGTPTITSLGGTNSYRVTIPLTALSTTATAFIYCATAPNAGGISYTGNGTSGVIASRAQFTTTPADTTYLATTTTARYGLPFEWSAAGTLQGILDEPQSTNLIPNINIATTFGASNVTVTSGITDPMGTNTAYRCTVNTSAASNLVLGVAGSGSASGNTYSFYCKRGSGDTDMNQIAIFNTTLSAVVLIANINFGTGVGTITSGTGTIAVVSVSGGWYRLSVSSTNNINAGNNLNIYIGCIGSSETAGEYTDFWLPQLEAGLYSSSPIQTAGSAVARAADNINIANTLFPTAAAAGTLFSQYSVADPTTGGVSIWYAASLNDGTLNNTIGLYRYQSKFGASIITGGVVQSDQARAVATPTAVHKNAIAYTTNDAIQCVDGTLSSQDTSVTVPTITQLSLSRANNNQVGKYIQKISYWPVRKSNTALQTLTT